MQIDREKEKTLSTRKRKKNLKPKRKGPRVDVYFSGSRPSPIQEGTNHNFKRLSTAPRRSFLPLNPNCPFLLAFFPQLPTSSLTHLQSLFFFFTAIAFVLSSPWLTTRMNASLRAVPPPPRAMAFTRLSTLRESRPMAFFVKQSAVPIANSQQSLDCPEFQRHSVQQMGSAHCQVQ